MGQLIWRHSSKRTTSDKCGKEFQEDLESWLVADWAGLDMSSLDWSFRGNKQLRTGLTGQGRVARANHTEAVVVAVRRISCLSQDAGAGQ